MRRILETVGDWWAGSPGRLRFDFAFFGLSYCWGGFDAIRKSEGNVVVLFLAVVGITLGFGFLIVVFPWSFFLKKHPSVLQSLLVVNVVWDGLIGLAGLIRKFEWYYPAVMGIAMFVLSGIALNVPRYSLMAIRQHRFRNFFQNAGNGND